MDVTYVTRILKQRSLRAGADAGIAGITVRTRPSTFMSAFDIIVADTYYF